MIKYITTLILTVFTLSLFGQVCGYTNSAYKAGEKLTYQLSYNVSFIWIPAGEVTFEIFENEEEYFVEVKGKTYDSYNSIFKVEDYFSSVIDKSTGRPKTFIRNVHEGNYTKFDSISFDHSRYNASGKIGKNRNAAKHYSMEISDCVHDIISILYAVRNVNLHELPRDENLGFTVFFDNEEYPLELEYRGVMDKEIKNMGKQNCHLLVPEVVAGEVFDEDSKMSIWVSNNQNQIPLLIESPVTIGSVKAILIDAENLKYVD
jgi:hypothetical protein